MRSPLARLFLALVMIGITGQFATAEQEGSSKDRSEGWIDLFNGNDLSGWKADGKARWEAQGGLLIGRQGPHGEAGDLLTEATYDDFELVVCYQVKWPANSGVWFRYQSPEQAYQADILEYKKPIAYSGSLYCSGKMFLAVNADPKLIDRPGWNLLVVRSQGDRQQISINGKQVADVRDDSSNKGRIGLQVHAGDAFTGMQISVISIKLRKL
jgi:3-keto-disaccharide hydrolase